MSPVRDGLRDRPERKPIIIENYYASLHYPDTPEHENNNIMVKVHRHGNMETVTINAMIDSGAMEDFIDQEVCNKHGIKMIKATNPREIYLADGKTSTMGPVTHMTKVPMDLSRHRELATFQVANLQNHEVILGMPWLRKHNPTIDWNDKKITFNDERCTTWCLNSLHVAYAIPEEKALEESLITRFSEIKAKQDQRVKVKKLYPTARVPTKESVSATGHDLYANEGTEIPAREYVVVGTGIASGLPHDTYGRKAPRSGLAVKHRLTTNAGVIDADHTGEVRVVLVNQGNQPYRVEKGDRIAQLIIERINNQELQEVLELDNTKRGDQGFGSSTTTNDQSVKPRIQINEISAWAFGQFYRRGEEVGILKWEEVDNEIQLEAINISTELAIKNKKNNEDLSTKEIVPRGYHHMLDVFKKGEKTTAPPHRPGVDLGIELEKGKEVQYKSKKIYPLSYDQIEELHRYIKQNESRGWIQRVRTGRVSPIMFGKKKDGKLRLCVDYRALNEITKKDRHPLPLISEALDRLAGAKYFTKLDIKDAYPNFRIKEGDEYKTAFSTKLGTYEYRVMPFRLCNAPAAIQRWINETLMEYIDMSYIVYLDDVLIYSNNLQQDQQDVRNMLEAIRTSGMKVKPSKCEFHKEETEYLGFIINWEGIKTDPIKTQAIWDWKTPKNKTDIQSFLEFCNFYRRFIEGFSRTAKPLFDRTEKKYDGKWERTDKEQQAFNELRRKLTTAPVMVHFNLKAPTKIETDTSKYVCSGILSQQWEDGNGDRWPINQRPCKTPNATTTFTTRNYWR